MLNTDYLTIEIPGDFAQRCENVNEAVSAGDPSAAEIARRLGLPIEFYKAAQALYMHLLTGKPIFIVPEPRGTEH